MIDADVDMNSIGDESPPTQTIGSSSNEYASISVALPESTCSHYSSLSQAENNISSHYNEVPV